MKFPHKESVLSLTCEGNCLEFLGVVLYRDVCEIILCPRILVKDTRTLRVLLKLVLMCQFPLFQVGVPEIREYSPLPDSRQLSFLFIVTQLNPMHFNNGQLIIKCTAHVSTLYRETSEVHLMSRTREPIPERGRLTKQLNKCIPSANNIAGNISTLFGLQ